MKQNTKQLCEALPYAAPSCKIVAMTARKMTCTSPWDSTNNTEIFTEDAEEAL